EFGWLKIELDTVEGFRHHADDRERSVIDRDCLADDGGIGGERLLPEVIAEDDDGAAAGSCIVCETDGAAKEGLRSDDAEIVAGDETCANEESCVVRSIFALGGKAHADLWRKAEVRGDALEGARIGLELTGKIPGEHATASEIDAAENTSSLGIAEGDQLLRILDGKIAEENLMDERK